MNVRFEDIVFHGVKARKIGHSIFERGTGSGYSLKYIDGKVWFADGSFTLTAAGIYNAKKIAAKMRKAGFKARVVRFADEVQTYCDSRKGASL